MSLIANQAMFCQLDTCIIDFESAVNGAQIFSECGLNISIEDGINEDAGRALSGSKYWFYNTIEQEAGLEADSCFKIFELYIYFP